MCLGIIPAAGKGSRWGGYYKELLPTGDGTFLIEHTIFAMQRGGVARKLCLVTTPEKISTHAQFLNREIYSEAYVDLFYVIQKERKDIWGAILSALPYAEDLNLFAMPDTIYTKEAFLTHFNHDFTLGLFKTNNGERFGVLDNNKIVNKSKDYGTSVVQAWGNFVFTKKVAEFWIQNQATIKDYTDAMNQAIQAFGYNRYYLDYYKDFANWEEYKSWIKSG